MGGKGWRVEWMGRWASGLRGGAAACFGKVESVLRPDLFVGMQRAAREGRVREIQGGRLRAVQGREEEEEEEED